MQTQICISQGESFRLGFASSLCGMPLSRGSIRVVAPVVRTTFSRCKPLSARALVQNASEESNEEAGKQQLGNDGVDVSLSTRRNMLATVGALGAALFSGKALAADVSAETMASGFLMFDDSDIPASKFFRIERIDKGVFRLERIEEGVPVGPSGPPPKPKAEVAAPPPPKVEPPPAPVEAPAKVEAKVEPPKEEVKVEPPKGEVKVEPPMEKVKVEPPKAVEEPPKPKAEAPKAEVPKVEAPAPPPPAPAPVPKAVTPEPEPAIKDDAAKRVLELYKKQQQEAGASAAAKKAAAPSSAPAAPPAPVIPEIVNPAPPSVEADPKAMEKAGRWAMIAASVGVAGWLLASASRSSMEDAPSTSTSSAPSPAPKKPLVKSPTPTTVTPVAAAAAAPSVAKAATTQSLDAQRDAMMAMSMAELRALARSLGLRGDTKMEIIDAIIGVSGSPIKSAPIVNQTARPTSPAKVAPTAPAPAPVTFVKPAQPPAAVDDLFDELNVKSIAELRAMAREKGVRGDTKKELINELLKASASAPTAAPKKSPAPSPVPVTNGAAFAAKPTAPAPKPEKTTSSYMPAGPPSKADQDFNADLALKSMAQLRAMARGRGLRGDTRKELTTALMQWKERQHQAPASSTPAPKSYTNGAVKTTAAVTPTPTPAPVKSFEPLNEDEVERLMEKTMGELRAMARERGVRGDTKKELVDILARTR